VLSDKVRRVMEGLNVVEDLLRNIEGACLAAPFFSFFLSLDKNKSCLRVPRSRSVSLFRPRAASSCALVCGAIEWTRRCRRPPVHLAHRQLSLSPPAPPALSSRYGHRPSLCFLCVVHAQWSSTSCHETHTSVHRAISITSATTIRC
jgi:hypothetical protein